LLSSFAIAMRQHWRRLSRIGPIGGLSEVTHSVFL
jgi:hypothetical protein